MNWRVEALEFMLFLFDNFDQSQLECINGHGSGTVPHTLISLGIERRTPLEGVLDQIGPLVFSGSLLKCYCGDSVRDDV